MWLNTLFILTMKEIDLEFRNEEKSPHTETIYCIVPTKRYVHRDIIQETAR